MDLELEGRTAIVCGGSSGIGLAIASQLIAEGANVVLSARSEDRLRRAADDIGAFPVRADLGSSGDLAGLAQATVAKFGGIDILFNSGAFVDPVGVLDLTDENLQEALDLFLFSAVRLTHICLPHLIESGSGRVINMAARAVREPNEHHATSAISRTALVGWAKSLSNEVAAKGVTVNTIASGWIRTESVDYAPGTLSIPMGRPGTPEELAAVVTFLASPRCSYLTGAVLPVDGGLTRFLL